MSKTFFEHCKHPHILKTSARAALLVGFVLAIINHADSFINGKVSYTQILQIIITFLVPFSVATYAAAKHAQRLEEMEEKFHHIKK